MESTEPAVLTEDGLQSLLDALKERGYRVIGPTVRDQAIVYDDVDGLADLPRGWTDEQDGGRYRLVPRNDNALFGYVVGPQSWKQFLHPPRRLLWQAARNGDDVEITPAKPCRDRFAFIGVRACELHAIAIQDRVFLGGAYVDSDYHSRREGAFIVANNCSKAGGTCFCSSMGTGPRAEEGFDLSLTEILENENGEHVFLIEAGSVTGQEVLAVLPHRAASAREKASAEAIVAATTESMGRVMPATDVPGLLMRNLEHPRWDDVTARCLSCSNCTMVCPTCFCTSTEDASDLTGTTTSRSQRWDSCFTMDFSYLHGGSVRASGRSRYRQWMTHKLATWVDQFGTSGCVGCGRCITWCPVGIDITEEVRAIHESEPDSGRKS